MSPFTDQGQSLNLPEDLQRAVAFHGHLCPGLMIGWRAAGVAMEKLGSGRSTDEEFIAIVENNSCAVDAVQVLTGATFGKGNFFFKDHGKQVYTFALRPSGRAVRLALKAGAFGSGPPSREERVKMLLDAPAEQLFTIEDKKIDLPGEAEIHKSLVCANCGEPMMDTRSREVDGKLLCLPCAEAAGH